MDDSEFNAEEDIYTVSELKKNKLKKTDKDSTGYSTTSDRQPSTLWQIALSHISDQSVSCNIASTEQSILFVGSKDSGKSTIVLRFLDHSEPPKPTSGLEYVYGRRVLHSSTMEKDVAHIWELGGGTWLSKLADTTITVDTLKYLSVGIVVDLSKPNELWSTLEHWLSVIRARISSIISDNGTLLKSQLHQMTWGRIGEDHEDRELLEPLQVPCLIIGSKYDLFQDFDPDARKAICRTLRFIAHRHGAHLQFFSTKYEALLSRTRSIISSLLFSGSLSKCLHDDHNKPLSITAGSDSFKQIGNPPVAEGDLGRFMAKTPMDLWKHAYVSKFPQENMTERSVVDDPTRDKQFAEAAVDAMRLQKDQLYSIRCQLRHP